MKRLFISFSGGKTSAYMTDRLLRECRAKYDEIVVGFANTGLEDARTLEYVEACDKQYGFNVLWLEFNAEPDLSKPLGFLRVDYGTASRDGEPFEMMCARYGLPGPKFPHCTRACKQVPIRHYLRSIGWGPHTYHTAIGIRVDEITRMSPRSMDDGAIYPLIDWRVDKRQVLNWEREQPVRLGIPEHWGNCVGCWKKSFRKLATVAIERPEVMVFLKHLEDSYKDSGPEGVTDLRMFRGNQTTADVIRMAQDPKFKPFIDTFDYKDEVMDYGQACGEFCEIGVDSSRDFGLLNDPLLE